MLLIYTKNGIIVYNIYRMIFLKKNRVIKEQQSEWKRHRWQRIKTKLLKRGLDAQYELVVKLPDRVHSWDVTLSLEEAINEFMVSFFYFLYI